MQSILKPMMLRRLKEDVEKNLAPKQETIIEVCVSGAHLLSKYVLVLVHLNKKVEPPKYLTVYSG